MTAPTPVLYALLVLLLLTIAGVGLVFVALRTLIRAQNAPDRPENSLFQHVHQLETEVTALRTQLQGVQEGYDRRIAALNASFSRFRSGERSARGAQDEEDEDAQLAAAGQQALASLMAGQGELPLNGQGAPGASQGAPTGRPRLRPVR